VTGKNRKPRKYVWVQPAGNALNGGIKATDDVHTIAEEVGWTAFCTGGRSGKIDQIIGLARDLGRLARLPKSCLFLIQAPCYGAGGKILAGFIVRRFKTIVLLHDIDRLRAMPRPSDERMVARGTCILETGKLLGALSVDRLTPIIRLEAWDYLLRKPTALPAWDPNGRILFAGNLSPAKVGWLYAGPQRPSLLLKGSWCEPEKLPAARHDRFLGPFTFDFLDLPEPVSFGLVWDGQVDYERINQPHKFSLYLACGLPVIVWKEAHVAAFVRAERCGIVVSSLEEIEPAIARLSPADKEVLRANALAVGEKMRRGDFLTDALRRCEAALNREPKAIIELQIESSIR
jgi:hypothetical protein